MGLKKYRFAAYINHHYAVTFSKVSEFCYQSRVNFYWLLAGLISSAILITSSLGISLFGAEQNTFDKLIRARWSSPTPSQEIVILDIDEKSLAQLAPSLGRWPWKREVMAEVLSEIESAGAKSVIFNVLITDPDINDKQSDAVLDEVASASEKVVFPLVRLPKENDSKSSLHASNIPGLVLKNKTNDPTVAGILPSMNGMMKSLGLSNLDTDDDGILRQYSINRVEDNWQMPTMIGRAISIAKLKPQVTSDTPYYLNWRNKKGTYQRISISDYIATLQGTGTLKPDYFNGKHVIIGASAAGISSPKATAANVLTDDNEILATALDDALNGTNLRPIPSWLLTMLAIIFIVYLAYMFSAGTASENTDTVFVAIEILSVGIMFIGMSYTKYFIDITPLATYGLAFFTIAKIHQSLAERVIKGSPEHLGELSVKQPRLMAIFAFEKEHFKRTFLKKQFQKLVHTFGDKSVFLCFDVFAGDTILSSLEDIGCLVILDKIKDQDKFTEKINTSLSLEDQAHFHFGYYNLPNNFESNGKLLEYISHKILIEVNKKLG